MPSFPQGSERSMRDAHNPAGGRMIIPPLPSHLSQHHQSSIHLLTALLLLLSLLPLSLTPTGGLQATKRGVGEISGRGGGRGGGRERHRE